ncbi:hypothetical protein DDZ13_11525 [Coraliomargarita sinensis]|uniref:Histidine kinase N-terminal 7TM region domain-containing protein n=1 Tax=Coraliomargarita sinensis TaxID=2174842 RepID=A0A317ZH96_9BACT|nr:YndJ family transporter [Coraliomargarita sinensis]PXA03603.1 hypothetical protein DDZ13_11525 [Coraliomargarita sinensis]
MDIIVIIALLAVPAVFAVIVGSVLLIQAFRRPKLLPEEVALACAWVFMVGSLVWLGAFLSNSILLGFGKPWTWLAAAHFAFAGFGAITVTSLSCRLVAQPFWLKVIRSILFLHPLAYLVTAAGILGYPYCDELGAMCYETIFILQLLAVLLGSSDCVITGPGALLVLSLSVPVVTLIPALAWAFENPLLDLGEMVRYHGMTNAIGHVGLGLLALSMIRPKSHSPVCHGLG